MSVTPLRCVLHALLCGMALATCAAQTAEQPGNLLSEGNCPANANFEEYRVRSSRVVSPFQFLRFIRGQTSEAASRISALVDGQPFLYRTAIDEALAIIGQQQFLPSTSDTRFRVALTVVSVENCVDHDLDLVYSVYSTQAPQVAVATPESRQTEKRAPQETAGVAAAGNPFQLSPIAGYDASDNVFAGARFRLNRRLAGAALDSFSAEGYASSRMHSVAASLSGSRDSPGWLAHAKWSVNYAEQSNPTGSGDIGGAHLSAQFSASTKPFANGNFTARFGGLIEGGNLHSNLTGVALSPDTVAQAGYGAFKLYAGASSRFPHNIFSISYGLQLGALDSAAGVDWIKQVADVSHQFWYVLGDHRLLELDSRFSAGGLVVPGRVPVAERFFGGNRDLFFIPGDAWKMRSTPVIRAIPANRFFRTSAGAGADRYFSFNFTGALDVWRRPLVPAEITRDARFEKLLQAQITSAESVEQIYFESRDPHYRQVLGEVPGLIEDLAELKKQLESVSPPPPALQSCAEAVNRASRRAQRAASDKGLRQYGTIRTLITSELPGASRACSAVAAPAIRPAAGQLERRQQAMQTSFQQIDQPAARAKAEADTKFVRRTLGTLFHEVNLYSISPVMIFDVARIGPEGNGLGGTRYGPGAGLRLGLVSSVNFTGGYAWNPSQRAGEGPGALFFSLEVRDLFH